MGKHPTSKARRKRQKLKRNYAKLREDAQLAGVIETVPEGAVRNEVAPVAPDPPLPHLVRQALRENWATPDCNKPAIVGSLIAPFYCGEADPALLIECARVLLLLDRTQCEQDGPEDAGNATGAGDAVAASVQANAEAAAFLNEMIERHHNFATDNSAKQ